MEKDCPKCGSSVEGEDLGDHPAWLDFCCMECGHSWGESVLGDMIDDAMSRYDGPDTTEERDGLR